MVLDPIYEPRRGKRTEFLGRRKPVGALSVIAGTTLEAANGTSRPQGQSDAKEQDSPNQPTRRTRKEAVPVEAVKLPEP